MEPAVAVQRFTDNFEDIGNDLGRQQRLAGGDDAYLAGLLFLQVGSALRAEISPCLREKTCHRFHQVRRQQVLQVFLSQLQQQ